MSRAIGRSPTAAVGALGRLAAVAALAAVAVLGASGERSLAATASRISPSNLSFPAGFAVTPNGARIVYGERSTGRIRWLNTTTGATSPLFTVPNVSHNGEQGLLGVALSRRFPDDARVWAYVTRTVSGEARNQLIRVRADRSGFTVLRSFPTFIAHNGGHIAFGPDGKLYVVVGENGFPALAQNLTSLAGKMLRLNADGTVPADNPRPANPSIAYGIRNSFGFTFDPRSGRLWETENGPECNDEVNLLSRMRLQNLGWGPSATCGSPPRAPYNTNRDGPNPVMPKRYFANPPALVGATFCRRCGLSSSGQLFFGSFNTGTIRRAALGSRRIGIASQAPFYDHPNPVLSLESPVNGGAIYFSTQSNVYRLDP
jgi:glucose/arabinose dehydrogenase